MIDKRLQLALHIATLPMRKPILEFAARGFEVVSIQLFYDADNETSQETLIEFAAPDGGAAFVVHEDGSVTEV
ncbi:MAG: hypothetical protein WCJ64_02170 [Rhodospirillaceae bacterium]